MSISFNPAPTITYRFFSNDQSSPIGQTHTLPNKNVDQIKFAVVSCSNYPAGRFHVYREIAQRSDIDVVLHLGDYIYEYQRGGFASEHADALGRAVVPPTELLTLDDYRQRYAQYRTDLDLQALHQRLPMIAVWDDHEIANNAWRHGAANHDSSEGVYNERKSQAIKAYMEWMPIRLHPSEDQNLIYRSFQFGELLSLHMLDTRHVGRDRPLSYDDYGKGAAFNLDACLKDLKDDSRSILGHPQKNWLLSQMASTRTTWQVIGQQVLLSRMHLPGALATKQLSVAEYGKLSFLESQRRGGSTLSPEDQEYLSKHEELLKMPLLPYNLDAWDAFETERSEILQFAQKQKINLVVLAGDTHNAWACDIGAKDDPVAVQFACPSVSSPGLEYYLKLPPESIEKTENYFLRLFKDLRYTNVKERGYLVVTFTQEKTTAEYFFVDQVFETTYRMKEDRYRHFSVIAGQNRIS